MGRWVYPLDPECPGVMELREWANDALDDPMTDAYGAGDIIGEMFMEKSDDHRVSCKRCQEHGAANVDVEY